MFKHLLLWNRFANQSQILCGASLGRANDSLYKRVQVTWPRWPPCPYMLKTLKNLLLQNQKSYDLETCHVALGTQALQNLYKLMNLDWPWPILQQGQIWSLMLLYGKRVKQWIFRKLLSSMICNWQQMTEVTRSFCWHQNFVPWGLYAPCPGAIYMY